MAEAKTTAPLAARGILDSRIESLANASDAVRIEVLPPAGEGTGGATVTVHADSGFWSRVRIRAQEGDDGVARVGRRDFVAHEAAGRDRTIDQQKRQHVRERLLRRWRRLPRAPPKT